MMGLGKPVTGPFKNGVIFGINSLDFWGVVVPVDGGRNPVNSPVEVGT